MSKKKPIVLFLEDNLLLRDEIGAYLEDEGFRVLGCKDIYEAKSEWKMHKSSISAIILDINMSPGGLTDKEKASANDGIFSGWMWLIDYVLVDKEYPLPVDKVFIVSGYIPNLERHIAGKTELGCEYFSTLKKKKHLINKGDKKNPMESIIEILKKELDLR